MFDFFEQPWTLLIAAIVAWLILLVIHGDSRLWWQSHLVIFLAIVIFVFNFLVDVGLLKINKVLTTIILTTLALVIAALLILQIIHIILTYERHRWQWLLPAFLTASAFGFDMLVKTETEKINAVINTGIKAVEKENPDAIEAIISDNYRDSSHYTKKQLMRYCRRLLSEPLVEKNKKRSLVIELSPPTATAVLTVLTRFDKESNVYRNYEKPSLLTKIKLHLQKGQDKKWLINRAEILQLDRQSAKWRDIK